MNARHCKRMRRLAEKMTVGKPARGHTAFRHTPRVRRNADGMPVTYRPVTQLNSPETTRGVYRALKRAARRQAQEQRQHG